MIEIKKICRYTNYVKKHKQINYIINHYTKYKISIKEKRKIFLLRPSESRGGTAFETLLWGK